MPKTRIMGVLNVTPDSFSDGGQFLDPENAVRRGLTMAEEGADIIDIGGESSRPGSEPVPEEEELRRVIPVIEQLATRISVPISIDTYKPHVAREAMSAGARIVNDITGLQNPEMIRIAAETNAGVVIMHMQGMPKDMQQMPVYTDVIAEISAYLSDRILAARHAGIVDIMVDPGIGFGKTLEHNLTILSHIRAFTALNCPVLIGPSRKSFIGTITGLPMEERLEGTLAAAVLAIQGGAAIIRAHDVKEMKRAAMVADAIVAYS